MIQILRILRPWSQIQSWRRKLRKRLKSLPSWRFSWRILMKLYKWWNWGCSIWSMRSRLMKPSSARWPVTSWDWAKSCLRRKTKSELSKINYSKPKSITRNWWKNKLAISSIYSSSWRTWEWNCPMKSNPTLKTFKSWRSWPKTGKSSKNGSSNLFRRWWSWKKWSRNWNTKTSSLINR